MENPHPLTPKAMIKMKISLKKKIDQGQTNCNNKVKHFPYIGNGRNN